MATDKEGVIGELVRFGVSAEEELMVNFDQLSSDKGYSNRSEGEISLVERFLMGERTQIFLFHGITIAWVDNPERKGVFGFGEIVARNRWVNGRVFTDLQAAGEWLLK